MGTRILEFGTDFSNHHLVLRNAGYEVRPCGSSLSGLEDGLRNWTPDAVVLMHDAKRVPAKKVLPLVRKHTAAPVIVFGAFEIDFEPNEVQLVIPPLSNPAKWLPEITKLLQQSKEIREKSQTLIAKSAELRKQWVQAKADMVRERERAEQQMEKDKKKKK